MDNLEKKIALSPLLKVSRPAQQNRAHEGMRLAWLQNSSFSEWASACGLVHPSPKPLGPDPSEEEMKKFRRAEKLAGTPNQKAKRLNDNWEKIHPNHRLSGVKMTSARESLAEKKLREIKEKFGWDK